MSRPYLQQFEINCHDFCFIFFIARVSFTLYEFIMSIYRYQNQKISKVQSLTPSLMVSFLLLLIWP